MRHKEKICGIIGGMGPEATIDLMHRIVKNTPATDDIDHIRCIVDNNPKVPSRIKALLEGGGENPGPCMADMARRLESYGADFLAIACNTAHYYYPYVQEAVTIPVLDIIELATKAALQKKPTLKKVGILASPAVRLIRLYSNLFDSHTIETIFPTPFAEEQLFAIIKKVKTGDTSQTVRTEFKKIIENIEQQGAEIGIIACTELGVIAEEGASFLLIDAAEELAKAIVQKAKE